MTKLPPSETFLRQAISEGNMNVLRIALYQQTGDPELAAMKVEMYERPGSPVSLPVLAKEHHEAVIEKAVAYLTLANKPVAPAPDFERAKQLMELFEGDVLSDAGARYAYEDLAFEGFPRQAKWRNRPAQNVLDEFMVTIIGAGFSAIIAAIQLTQLGIPFRIIDRQADFGGTWCLNDYPEARVDVTNFLYQFKFERGYPWKHFFAPRDELVEYVNFIVDKYGLRQHAVFNTQVENAFWDEGANEWVLTARDQNDEVTEYRSNFVFSASGLFSTPNLPDIDGIETFQGAMFHTTNWDHNFDYKGKRVALLGTGSTGSQLMRAVAAEAEELVVFQRTPNWVTSVPNYRAKVPEGKQWLLDNMPSYANWFCYSHHTNQVRMQDMHDVDFEWKSKGGIVNEKNDQVRFGLTKLIKKLMGERTDLAEKITPDFAPMSRRLVIDNGWYETLLRDNVTLVTDDVTSFTQTGIVTEDAQERPFDLVVLAAGFKVEQYLWPVPYRGRNNASLEDLWTKDGARAYLTMTMPGFPNFFMFYGPNGQTRAGSFHSWAEVLSRYICDAVVTMIERGAKTIEVKKDIYEEFNNYMDEQMDTVLYHQEQGGGRSYYLNSHGRSGTQMPFRFDAFFEMVEKVNPEDFEFGE